MKELPLHIKKSIEKYAEIKVDGLTLYPIKVSEYEEFLQARPALEFMQQSLPIEYMSMPILQAFFKLDVESALKGERASGLFMSSMIGLALALRLTTTPTPEEIVKRFVFIADKEDPTKLKYITTVINGMEEVKITPVQYSRLREIIAAQNGVEIPDTDDNPELVKAEQDLAQQGSPQINMTVSEMVASVAALGNIDENDIYDWAILKLNNRIIHYQRVLDYLICGIGATNGASWKGGNPCPSPFFRKITDDSSALINIEDFAGGQGVAAVQNANTKTTAMPN